jgi:hypothetical protein
VRLFAEDAARESPDFCPRPLTQRVNLLGLFSKACGW